MSETIELPLNIQCYLCDSLFCQSQQIYILYKCFTCMKFTPYCLPCELKMQKLLGRGIFFKCNYCDKLTNALDKIEVSPQNFLMNMNPLTNSISINNNPCLKTPIKPLDSNQQSSSIKYNKIISLAKPKTEEERKDNSINNDVLTNFINEFKKVELEINSKNNGISQIGDIRNCSESNNNLKKNNSISLHKGNIYNYSNKTLANSNSVNKLNKINDFSLLKSRKRFNKGFGNATFLGKKRDDSNSPINLRGCNKSKEKSESISASRDIFGTTKPKRIITKNNLKLGRTINGLNNFNNGLCSTSNNSRRHIIDLKSCLMNRNPEIHFTNSGNNEGFNTISGTVTPHRLYVNNNDEIYF